MVFSITKKLHLKDLITIKEQCMFNSMDELQKYIDRTPSINFDVMYNPISNRIVLSSHGRRVEVMGAKGVFYTRHEKLSDGFVKIGELV